MKTKNKVERYIEIYCKKLITNTVYSARSTYYHFGHRIIRVSDHVALKSDGDLSIILDSHDDEHFIVHAVHSGELSVVNYKELKEIIRVFRLLPAVVYVANIPEKPKVVEQLQKVDPPAVLSCKPTSIGGKLRTIKTDKYCKIKEVRVPEEKCFILGVSIDKLSNNFVQHVATQVAKHM